MKKYKTAIMGCTGLVGQHFIRMLDQHPLFQVEALYASESSAGQKYSDIVKWWAGGEIPDYARNMTIRKIDPFSLLPSEIPIVFSALTADSAGKIESLLRKHHHYVFSNTRTHRMDSDVPIVIPEVNAEHMEMLSQQKARHGGFIVTNSNCSTSGLAMALKPIMKYGIQSVFVSTYQAISGAGMKGLAAMAMEGNIIPFIDGEERKMEVELQKILSAYQAGNLCQPDIPVTANCCRVPVRTGHLEAVAVQLGDDVGVDEIISSWSEYRSVPQDLKLPSAPEYPILVRNEDDRPQPILDCRAGLPRRAEGMAVTIGRVRKKDNILRFLLLVNNMIRGASGTSLLNAELAVSKGFVDEKGAGRFKGGTQ